MKRLLGACAFVIAAIPVAGRADVTAYAGPRARVLTYAARSDDATNGTIVGRSGFVRVTDASGRRTIVALDDDGRERATASDDAALQCFALASRIVPVAARSTPGVPTDAGTLETAFASGSENVPLVLDVEAVGAGVSRASVEGTMTASARVATFRGAVDYANGIVLGAQFATAASGGASGVSHGTCRLSLILPAAAPATSVPAKNA